MADFVFAAFSFADRQAHERAAEFDDNARIGRQISLADDAADGAFAADQNGFDVAAVLIGNDERRQTRSAWEVDDLDIIAGIVEQVVRVALFLHKMRTRSAQNRWR